MAPVTFRFAEPEDAGAVGALHAESWRRHYRGAYADAYLDGPVDADRHAVWSERLGEEPVAHYTVVAVDGDELVGFAHTRLDIDPQWGSLLDNLHVAFARPHRRARAAWTVSRRRHGTGVAYRLVRPGRAPRRGAR